MLNLMSGYRTSTIGQLVLKVGSFAVGLVFTLLGTLREVFASSDSTKETDRSIQDADLVGDYNFRTQRFDSGTDPAGWYEDEP